MHVRIILKSFGKYKCPGIAFLLQSSRYVSNEQSCLKTTGLYDDLLLLSSLFHFFYFIFSTSVSFSLCSPISTSLSLSFFFNILFQVWLELLSKTARYFYDSIYWFQEKKMFTISFTDTLCTTFLPTFKKYLTPDIHMLCM